MVSNLDCSFVARTDKLIPFQPLKKTKNTIFDKEKLINLLDFLCSNLNNIFSNRYIIWVIRQRTDGGTFSEIHFFIIWGDCKRTCKGSSIYQVSCPIHNGTLNLCLMNAWHIFDFFLKRNETVIKISSGSIVRRFSTSIPVK